MPGAPEGGRAEEELVGSTAERAVGKGRPQCSGHWSGRDSAQLPQHSGSPPAPPKNGSRLQQMRKGQQLSSAQLSSAQLSKFQLNRLPLETAQEVQHCPQQARGRQAAQPVTSADACRLWLPLAWG